MTEKTAKGHDLARGERMQIMLDAAELKAVDDFRFSRRMPSRAAAIRELLRRGLLAEGFSFADVGMRSHEFGVLDADVSDARGGNGKRR